MPHSQNFTLFMGKNNLEIHPQVYIVLAGGFKHVFSIIYIYIWDNPSHRLILFNMVKTTNQLYNSKGFRLCVDHGL